MHPNTSPEFLKSQGFNETLPMRFFSKINKTETCWIWTGCLSASGYGRVIIRMHPKTREYSHRVSYTLHYGIAPGEKFVCHSCDTPNCVNPSHLWLGTQMENIADMCKKGRNTLGEVNGMHKLVTQQVVEIRNLYPYKSLTQLAKQYGVKFQAISKIVNRQRWKHIK